MRKLKKVYIKPYGCQQNVYDAERMVDLLSPHGFALTDELSSADVAILNTCHIREKAEQKVFSDLGRIKLVKDQRKRDGKSMTIAVGGCVGQAEGKEIITVTISSKISGTYNSACLAAEMVDESKITIVDSLQCGANIAELAKIALEMANDNKSRKEIAEKLNDQKERMNVRIVPKTLDYLRKGGRLSNIASFVGNLINLKPIVGFNEGKLEVVAKTRGFKKAIKLAISDIPPEVKVINITHVVNLDAAIKLKNEVVMQFPDAEVNITEIGPVVGSHNGPGTLGLVYLY